jgi:hypothetical protein
MTTPDRMYDAVNVEAIPADARMVAGYVDGGYVTWPALVRRFPHARKVSITTTGDAVADVCDVESGDASPQKSVVWVKAMRRLGRRPIVYTSAANVRAVDQAFEAEREQVPFVWIADWTGEVHEYFGAVATQYASPSVPPPGMQIGYDISTVSPNWPDPIQKKRGPMNIKLPSWATFYRVLALAGSALGIVVGLGNQLHLPASLRAVLLAASAGIVWIEHHKVTSGFSQKPPPPPRA